MNLFGDSLRFVTVPELNPYQRVPPKYGRVRSSGMKDPALTRGQVTGILVVAILAGSALVTLVFQTSQQTNACSTCDLGDLDAGYGPVDMVYDNSSGRIFVLDSGAGGFNAWGVTIINGSSDTVAGFIHSGGRPGYSLDALAFDPRNGDLYTPHFCYDGVFVLNVTTGANVTYIDTPTTGICAGPQTIVYDPVSDYILALAPPNLIVIDPTTNTVVRTVDLGIGAYPVGVNPATGQVYVMTSVQGEFLFNLTVLNGSTLNVESSIQLNGTPDAIVFDSLDDRVDVAVTVLGFGGGAVYNGSLIVLNPAASHVFDSTRVGENPSDVAIDLSNREVYIANFYSGNISIVNGTSYQPAGSVPVDPDPESISYDAQNGCLYVLFYTQLGSNPETDGYVTVLAPPGGSCRAVPTGNAPAWAGSAVLGGLAIVVAAALVWHGRRREI